jgi:hypothetical protein
MHPPIRKLSVGEIAKIQSWYKEDKLLHPVVLAPDVLS